MYVNRLWTAPVLGQKFTAEKEGYKEAGTEPSLQKCAPLQSCCTEYCSAQVTHSSLHPVLLMMMTMMKNVHNNGHCNNLQLHGGHCSVALQILCYVYAKGTPEER